MVGSGKTEEAINVVSTPAPLPSSIEAEPVTGRAGGLAISISIPFLPSNSVLVAVWSKGREDGANNCLLMDPGWALTFCLVLNAVLREQRQREGICEITPELQDCQLTEYL